MSQCSLRRSAGICLAAGAAMFATLPAHAICGRPPPVNVWPHRGVPVPTNAHVFMTAPTTWRGDAKLTVATAPRKGKPIAHVALKEQSWRAAGTERFELAPLAPLEPSTAYEVRSSRSEVVGAFTTSVLEDKRPPTWGGITSGRLFKEERATSKATPVPVECGTDLLTLEGEAPASDDQTITDDIRYALWAGKPGTPIDYNAPPLTWTTRSPAPPMRMGSEPPKFQITFGSSEPDANDFELPKERPLRVGVKAYDFAANATPPSELTLP